MSKIVVLIIFTGIISGCGQSALDKCTDGKSHLWNPKAIDNTYKGNEQYWDAIAECENKNG